MADQRPITLLNPHADDFIETPVSFELFGRRGLRKYAYLIEEPKRQGKTVDILVDGTLSSLVPQAVFNLFPRFIRHLFLKFELKYWLRLNNLEDCIRVHWNADTIEDRTYLYMMSYKNCVGNFSKRLPYIEKFKYKIVNMTHYFILTSLKGKNIKSINNVIITSEYDLRNNDYFVEYLSKDFKFISVPFAVSARFSKRKALAERKAECVATGTFHNLYEECPREYYQDFINFFKSSTYHPIRKSIYERKEQIKDRITCYVFPYREHNHNKSMRNFMMHIFRIDVAQRAYFSIDIVDTYNSFVFAVIGEELSGLPAIGFFEAMACGCVTLGQGTEYYEKLGLVAGTHYLPHDGTVDGILDIVEKYAGDPETLERISAAGLRYVADNCTPAAVWNALQEKLSAYPA